MNDMDLQWKYIPAMTGITKDGQIGYYKAGYPLVGISFTTIIVRVDHPDFTIGSFRKKEQSRHWLLSCVRTCLKEDGQWIEVTG